MFLFNMIKKMKVGYPEIWWYFLNYRRNWPTSCIQIPNFAPPDFKFLLTSFFSGNQSKMEWKIILPNKLQITPSQLQRIKKLKYKLRKRCNLDDGSCMFGMMQQNKKKHFATFGSTAFTKYSFTFIWIVGTLRWRNCRVLWGREIICAQNLQWSHAKPSDIS